MLQLRILPGLLFMALLLLPFVAGQTGFPAVSPLEEYRSLAQRPHSREFLRTERRDFLGYTSAMNNWYSDQFTTRPFWVRLHTQLLYSLFGESREVHIGFDGWLYYRSVLETEMLFMEGITPEYWDGMVARVAHLTDLLEQRGITLYLLPLGLKYRYYPEFLPASGAHARRSRHYDMAMDKLAANAGINLIDSRAVLENAKAAGLKTFHQTDFHWTDPAGVLTLEPLLRDIGRREGLPALANSWSYDIIDVHAWSGGQGRALPLFIRLAEDTVELQLRGPLTTFTYARNANGIEKSGIAQPGQEGRFSPIFVFGDSFFDAADRAGFFNFFSGFARARIYDNNLVESFRHRPATTRYMIIEYTTGAMPVVDESIIALIAELETVPASTAQ